MRVLLDGDLLNDLTVSTVGEAMSVASDVMESQGRMIVEVNVDGERWDERRIEQEMQNATEAGEVNLTSCDRNHLVADAYRDAAESLTEADALQREAADHIQAAKSAEAMNSLNQAVEIWQSVQRAVLMGLQITTSEKAKTADIQDRLTMPIDRLNQHLTIIRDALQCDDPVGVSDTLLYDMPDVIQEWRGLLNELQATLQG
ncbi:MAG: hypothetical protein O7G85_01090 [Planctomycetota bacterium]|nr:hypothetical protein [Planctomycetota bacterium]